MLNILWKNDVWAAFKVLTEIFNGIKKVITENIPFF